MGVACDLHGVWGTKPGCLNSHSLPDPSQMGVILAGAVMSLSPSPPGTQRAGGEGGSHTTNTQSIYIWMTSTCPRSGGELTLWAL